jgi:hypothetical protein
MQPAGWFRRAGTGRARQPRCNGFKCGSSSTAAALVRHPPISTLPTHRAGPGGNSKSAAPERAVLRLRCGRTAMVRPGPAAAPAARLRSAFDACWHGAATAYRCYQHAPSLCALSVSPAGTPADGPRSPAPLPGRAAPGPVPARGSTRRRAALRKSSGGNGADPGPARVACWPERDASGRMTLPAGRRPARRPGLLRTVRGVLGPARCHRAAASGRREGGCRTERLWESGGTGGADERAQAAAE